jgi:hypothetical protein
MPFLFEYNTVNKQGNPTTANLFFPGTHGVLVRRPWELLTQRTSWLGITGESEIGGRGSGGGRDLIFEHWLHAADFQVGGFVNRLQVENYIFDIETRIGDHGRLIYRSVLPASIFGVPLPGLLQPEFFEKIYANVTLDAFEIRPDTGVFFEPSKLGWMTIALCRFRQLAP